MKICIVGCTGYIGSTLASHFGLKGDKVIGVCRNFPKKNKQFKNFFYKIIEGDITNLKIIEQIISIKPNFIVYTVSLNHKDSEESLYNAISINFIPLTKLCDLIKKKKQKTKFIYFSTMQVYGNYALKKIVKENSQKELNNYYALTHSLCEDTLRIMNSNSYFQSTSIRLSNGYGNPQLNSCDCWWLVINDFCMNAIKNNKIIINSDGSPLRDFIHIKDIAFAVEKLLFYKKELPNTINLASGTTISMLKIASIVQKICSKKFQRADIELQKQIVSKSNLKSSLKRINLKKRFKISIETMKKIKILPKISIEKGIYDTLKGISKL